MKTRGQTANENLYDFTLRVPWIPEKYYKRKEKMTLGKAKQKSYLAKCPFQYSNFPATSIAL